MTRPAPSLRECGFTLLEVLVAVSILSLISLATLRLAGSGVDAAQHMRGKTMAMIVAENALVDVLLDDTAARGTQILQTANLGKPWRVTQTLSAMPDERVLRVDILVEGGEPVFNASLSSFKVVAADE